jgi:ADP-ribose pyrophosphatase
VSAPAGVYPDSPRVAVGAVVFRADRVLLVLRGSPPARGTWAIPGGSVRLGESLRAAAERETREETGVIVRAGAPIYTFEVVERDPRGAVRFRYVIVDLAAEYVSGSPRAGDDALDARWVSAAELADLPVNPATRRLLRRQFGFSEKSNTPP